MPTGYRSNALSLFRVVGSFTGVYLGMYATGNGKASSAPADFDWFEYYFKQ